MDYSTDKSSEITISLAKETMVDVVVQVTMRKKQYVRIWLIYVRFCSFHLRHLMGQVAPIWNFCFAQEKLFLLC